MRLSALEQALPALMNARNAFALVACLMAPTLHAAGAPEAKPAGSGETFDFKAERARREKLREEARTEAEEKFKKSGAAYVIYRVEPEFPAEAKQSTYVLHVIIRIDETGVVRGLLFPDKPEPLFEEAAMKAILQWRYSPQKIDGRPVRAEVQESIHFSRPLGKAKKS